MVPKASSKVKVVAVLRLPKRGPKNGTPFLEPVESVPTRKGPKKGSEIRARFWPRFSRNLAFFPVKFLNSQVRNKPVENKPWEFTTSCVDFKLAGAADQQAGNNKKQQQLCGIVRLCITPTSKQDLPTL